MVNHIDKNQSLCTISDTHDQISKKNQYLNCFQEIVQAQAECIEARISLLDRVVCFTMGSLLGGLAGGSLKIEVISIIYLLTLSASSGLFVAWKGPFFINKIFPRTSLKEELTAIFNQRLIRLLAADPRLVDAFDPSTFTIKIPFSEADVRIDCVLGYDLIEFGRYFPKAFLQGIREFRLALYHEGDRLDEAFFAKVKELRQSGKMSKDKEEQIMRVYCFTGRLPENLLPT